MPKRGRNFNQRRPRRAERSRILIVSEGVKTEVQYLEGLTQFLRSVGTAVRGVRAKGIGRDPLRVLQAALDINAQDTDGFDEVWVVVDVDEHATLDEALRAAKRHGVSVVVSNPCFEIWLVWHYEDCAAYQETRAAIERLLKYKHTEKSIPIGFPYEAYEDATRRAGAAAAPGEVGPNPSTAMPSLVAALQRRP